ncbi:MAG: hypothetical protein WCL49_12885 [bacterium]
MKFAMNDGILPIGHSPYVLSRNKPLTRPNPTPTQQRILDQMLPGIWYAPEPGKDRQDSCRALYNAGWLWMACIAKPGPNGQLIEKTCEDLLVDIALGKNVDEPVLMYRMLKKGELKSE